MKNEELLERIADSLESIDRRLGVLLSQNGVEDWDKQSMKLRDAVSKLPRAEELFVEWVDDAEDELYELERENRIAIRERRRILNWFWKGHVKRDAANGPEIRTFTDFARQAKARGLGKSPSRTKQKVVEILKRAREENLFKPSSEMEGLLRGVKPMRVRMRKSDFFKIFPYFLENKRLTEDTEKMVRRYLEMERAKR